MATHTGTTTAAATGAVIAIGTATTTGATAGTATSAKTTVAAATVAAVTIAETATSRSRVRSWAAMPRFRPTSPLGLAFGAFHLWRRLPPSQRKRFVRLARQHGPKVAAALMARRRPKR
jgi:hypothetical protein